MNKYLISKKREYCLRIEIIKKNPLPLFDNLFSCIILIKKCLAATDIVNITEGSEIKTSLFPSDIYEFENDNDALLFYEVM